MKKWQFLNSLKKGEPVDEEPFAPIFLKTPGFCLRAGKAVDFEYQKDVMGAQYYCPYCGRITERQDSPLCVHIFNPPPVLVEILEKAQSFYPRLQTIRSIVARLDQPALLEEIDRFLQDMKVGP